VKENLTKTFTLYVQNGYFSGHGKQDIVVKVECDIHMPLN